MTRPDRHATAADALRESGDGDRRVVCRLTDRWRVIVCRDGIPWILQRRDGERFGRARWTGRHHCTMRESLIRLFRASCGRIDPGQSPVLLALPGTIMG